MKKLLIALGLAAATLAVAAPADAQPGRYRHYRHHGYHRHHGYRPHHGFYRHHDHGRRGYRHHH